MSQNNIMPKRIIEIFDFIEKLYQKHYFDCVDSAGYAFCIH